MQRHASYSYPQMAAPTHRYSGTSSAFSPSANPNEDWTKISDLAERRRIQNRIAQRNYRKKLKKRLEDLERRAASNSASPEQQPAELHRSNSRRSEGASSAEPVKQSVEQSRGRRTPDLVQSQYSYHPQEDRSMFTTQYTRQLSTSPPPFSYSTYPTETVTYAPYPQYTYQPTTTVANPEVPLYTPCLPPLPSNYPATIPYSAAPVKQEYYGDDEISPFSMSYASMAGIDIPVSQQLSYQEPQLHTPPLSDSFDLSTSASPPDTSMFPTTPGPMPSTPPLHFV